LAKEERGFDVNEIAIYNFFKTWIIQFVAPVQYVLMMKTEGWRGCGGRGS